MLFSIFIADLNRILPVWNVYFDISILFDNPRVKDLKMTERKLTHFSPTLHFYTPRKLQNIKGFLTFSSGIEMEHWAKTD